MTCMFRIEAAQKSQKKTQVVGACPFSMSISAQVIPKPQLQASLQISLKMPKKRRFIHGKIYQSTVIAKLGLKKGISKCFNERPSAQLLCQTTPIIMPAPFKLFSQAIRHRNRNFRHCCKPE
jgi:hypothetical protein